MFVHARVCVCVCVCCMSWCVSMRACVRVVCMFGVYLVLILFVSVYVCNKYPFPLRSHGREVNFVSKPPDLLCGIPSLPFNLLHDFFPGAKAAGA